MNSAGHSQRKTMRVDALAKTIAADILAERQTVTFPSCFMCSRTYSKGAPAADASCQTPFCLTLCRDAFDAGLPPYEPDRPRAILNAPLQNWVVVAGPPGAIGYLPMGASPYRTPRRFR
jgi:hypothetical protein